MTTAAKGQDRGEWERRALELAQASHLDGTARYLGRYTMDDGTQPICWHVPSRDRSSTYTVEFHVWNHLIRCHCTAGSYGHPCCHAGAVVHVLRQREQAYATAERERQPPHPGAVAISREAW